MVNSKKGEKAIKVIQVRSAAGRDKRTHKTLQAMGLGRIGKSQSYPDNSAIRGMLNKVQHLLEITESK